MSHDSHYRVLPVSQSTVQSLLLLGVDTGGTFTDFVLYDGQAVSVYKTLSTPDAPERAILEGIAAMGLQGKRIQMTHGSTVATNAVLENKTARTAYVANTGLADVIEIGRQAREELYNLQPAPQIPPVADELRFEVDQRTNASGQTQQAMTTEVVNKLLQQIRVAEPEAVAINLLFSFLDDTAECEIEAALQSAIPDLAISRSSYVLPEYREYERGMATWLNAAVAPLIGSYLKRLIDALPETPIAIMQSSAGSIAATQAARRGVNLLLSGPAGGLLAARHIGRLIGESQLLTFDMGGTSTDVAMIEHDFRLTSEGRIGRYPVAVPMVDMHTIGAGGGSIASVDAAGLLHVGPESAGAMPGPACYGQVDVEQAVATVTDAHVVLGRLPHQTRLGGDRVLDEVASSAVIQRLADESGLTPEQAAQGVIDLANEHMVQALRVISIQKGRDPADFALMCFGGAGGLHVCALADALGMRRAIVPIHGGVLSALGMLVAPRMRELSRSILRPLTKITVHEIDSVYQELEAAGRHELISEGVSAADISHRLSADLRYQGQSSVINQRWLDIDRTTQAFHAEHESRYGHRLDHEVELVNLRVRLEAKHEPPQLPDWPTRPEGNELAPQAWQNDVPIYPRDGLCVDDEVAGPAIISEDVSTTFIEKGWCCRVDKIGNLRLSANDRL